MRNHFGIQTCLAGALLCCALSAAGDALDRLSSQLDSIEHGFWFALRHSDGAYRRTSMDKRLRVFENLARSIQNQSTLNRKIHNAPSIAAPASRLQSIFSELSSDSRVIRRFRFKFEGTSLVKFRPEFVRYCKEQAESEEDSGGKRRRRRVVIPRMTLKNIPPERYDQWLADIIAKNLEKFQRDTNHGNSSEQRRINNAVGEYLSAINSLRRNMVKLRQRGDFEYK